MGTDNEAVVDYILSIVDTDKDGKISFEEFRTLMVNESFHVWKKLIIIINEINCNQNFKNELYSKLSKIVWSNEIKLIKVCIQC